ncbi:MAG TPA: hypothetical protein VLA67_14805 [Nitrospiraceae bacterium]|nr:hypothetical protein [Nitrospiraceae bacterium]
MFGQIMARTDMTKFWEYMFDVCNQEYSCVLGWVLVGILGVLAVVLGLVYMMNRLVASLKEEDRKH